MPAAIAIVAAYLIGSFPTAYLVARIRKGFDIRQVGSRNLGAMNVFYKVGFWAGMMVLAGDIGKGIAGVAFARWLGTPDLVQFIAGAMVIIGHNFPIFLKFHGGRGGASCIGILIYLMPWGIPIYAALFGLGLLLTHFPTLSYSLAFLCFPFVGWFIYHSWQLAVYTIALLMLPLLKYIPRIIEMRRSGGSWKHVLYRRNLKDRL
ncbi:MAG: glycerol-3-phosphate acyltransferase [Dehalococcoidales bacterium]|nr:glycerol-3-phosphate acyltransferase [Dehalococcoidales bacterium]